MKVYISFNFFFKNYSPNTSICDLSQNLLIHTTFIYKPLSGMYPIWSFITVSDSLWVVN